jgi:hypothetical protein
LVLKTLPQQNKFMAIFKDNKTEEEKREKSSTNLNIETNPTLPSADIVDKVSDNKQVPNNVRKRHWAQDLPFAAFSNLNTDKKSKVLAEAQIIQDMKDLTTQSIYVYDLEADLVSEFEDLDYMLDFDLALDRANKDLGTQLKDQVLSSTTLVQTKHETGERDKQKKRSGGLKGFLLG